LSLLYLDSRTFKDLLHQIPKLSRTYSIFKDFLGPGKMSIFFQGLSRPCGHPAQNKKVDENQQKQTGRGTTIISSNENMKN